MCEPNSKNQLFKLAESIYKATIGTPESSVVRMNMHCHKEFDNYSDAFSNIENQVFAIQQKYYFAYVNEYFEFKGKPEGLKREFEYKLLKKSHNYCIQTLLFKKKL
jgi:hypothetical protein